METPEIMLENTMAGFAARLAYHRNSPRAKAAAVRDGMLEIELATGATISIPARQLRHLANLTDEQLQEVRVVAGGRDLMWRSADVDLGVDWLLQALTGLPTHVEVARKTDNAPALPKAPRVPAPKLRARRDQPRHKPLTQQQLKKLLFSGTRLEKIALLSVPKKRSNSARRAASRNTELQKSPMRKASGSFWFVIIDFSSAKK